MARQLLQTKPGICAVGEYEEERASEGESKQETLLESNKEDREEETRGGGGRKRQISGEIE